MSLLSSAQALTPVSPNWEWTIRDLEFYAAVELFGIYKGSTKAVIRTKLSYSLLINNQDRAKELIALTVKKAEDEVEIIESPLAQVMSEDE